jgi:hypothetical protein
METTWLYAWIAVVSLSARGAVRFSFWHLLALPVAAAWLTRLSETLPWRHPRNRLPLLPAVAGAMLVWLHLVLAPGAGWDGSEWLRAVTAPWTLDETAGGDALFTVWALALYCCCRGIWIGLRPATVVSLARWLLGGMAVFVALFVVLASARDAVEIAQPLGGQLRLLVAAYFFIGLSLMALVHSQALERATGARHTISLSWIAATAAPIGVIVLAGLAFTGEIAPVVRWTMRVGVQTALLLWAALLWLGYWLLFFLRWLGSLFPAGDGGEPSGGPPGPPLRIRPPASQQSEPTGIPIDATLPVSLLILAVLAGVLIFLVFRRRPGAETEAYKEERTSLWSWALFWSQLRALWSALLARLFRRRGARAAGADRGDYASTPTAPNLPEIRQIYRRMLHWAAARQQPRRPSHTPLELARELTAAAPALGGAIETITAQYVVGRYGEITLVGPMLESARRAARRIEEEDQLSAD